MNIGPGELILVLIVALIVFGPRRLPEVARELGKAIRDFNRTSQELTSQFRNEIQAVSAELEATNGHTGHKRKELEEPGPDKPPAAQDAQADNEVPRTLG